MEDAAAAAAFLERFSHRIYYGTAAYTAQDTYPMALDQFLTALVQAGKLSRDAYCRIIRRNAEALLARL